MTQETWAILGRVKAYTTGCPHMAKSLDMFLMPDLRNLICSYVNDGQILFRALLRILDDDFGVRYCWISKKEWLGAVRRTFHGFFVCISSELTHYAAILDDLHDELIRVHRSWLKVLPTVTELKILHGSEDEERNHATGKSAS